MIDQPQTKWNSSQAIMAALCAALILLPAGCNTISLPGRLSAASAIRSQNEASESEPDSGQADYGAMQSRFFGSESPPPTGTPGHTLLQPKARLRRPIPLPETVAQATDGADVNSSQTKVEPGNTLEFGSAIGETTNSSDDSTPDANTENGEETTDIANGATEPIPNDTGKSSPLDKGQNDPSPSESPDGSMLSRLRNLYSPRADNNSEKIRRQMRRWPDPFGLLKDRDEAAEEIPATPSPAVADSASDGGRLQTAEAPQEQPSVTTALDAAIAELEKELADWPRTPSGRPERIDEWRKRQTDLRMLYMIAGESADSIRMISSLPEDEQEFWQSVMLAMNHFRDTNSETNRQEDLTATLEQLRAAVRRLQPLASLEIQRLMFCSRIDGFGRATVYPTSDFEPGQRILVYAGIRNFRSELNEDGRFRSEFAAVIEFLREGEDEVLETIQLPRIEDECDEERTDYYQSFELTAPALEGNYLVRIRLRDQLSMQTAEGQLSFTIH